MNDISTFLLESSPMYYSTSVFSTTFGGIVFWMIQDLGRVTSFHSILFGTKDLEFEGSDWRRIVSPFGPIFNALVLKAEALSCSKS